MSSNSASVRSLLPISPPLAKSWSHLLSLLTSPFLLLPFLLLAHLCMDNSLRHTEEVATGISFCFSLILKYQFNLISHNNMQRRLKKATDGTVLYSSTSRTLWLYGQNLMVYNLSRPDCSLGHSSPTYSKQQKCHWVNDKYVLLRSQTHLVHVTHTHMHTHTHTHNDFMALCPGLRGWAGSRRNTHPPTILISFFHLPRSIACSLFKLHAWQSYCTTSLHVLFGLPLGLEPSTSYSIHIFTQSVSSYRNRCPYQMSQLVLL